MPAVRSCRIDSKVLKEPGDLDGDALLVTPVKIVLPQRGPIRKDTSCIVSAAGLALYALWSRYRSGGRTAMSFLAEPKGYTPDEFRGFVDGLEWNGWRPKFVTLHNTGVPSLAEWLDSAHDAKQRIESQRHYERDILHWHSGVHLFVAPDLIWNLCDLTQDGVSVSCWNHLTIGIEMIGDYATETFDIGAGAQVRDHAVAAMAILHRKLGLRPDRYREGVCGLHFHKECNRDHHDCPGKNVVKADVVVRILREMEVLDCAATAQCAGPSIGGE